MYAYALEELAWSEIRERLREALRARRAEVVREAQRSEPLEEAPRAPVDCCQRPTPANL